MCPCGPKKALPLRDEILWINECNCLQQTITKKYIISGNSLEKSHSQTWPFRGYCHSLGLLLQITSSTLFSYPNYNQVVFFLMWKKYFLIVAKHILANDQNEKSSTPQKHKTIIR